MNQSAQEPLPVAENADDTHAREPGASRVPTIERKELKGAESDDNGPAWHSVAAFATGVIFTLLLLLLISKNPNPTEAQFNIYKTVLAIACAGTAAVIPGMLHVRVSGFLRAGGALAVFVLVFLKSPAGLVAQDPDKREREIRKPLLEMNDGTSPAPFTAGLPTGPVDSLVIDRPLTVPKNTVIVANKIDFTGRGSLEGEDFVVAAGRLRNGVIKSQTAGRDGRAGGRVLIFAGEMSNTQIDAAGGAGRKGKDGTEGKAGENGTPGIDAKAGSSFLGQSWVGSTSGNDGKPGEKGASGENGQQGGAGGIVEVATISATSSSKVAIGGGTGGAGGAGGKGGRGGNAGKGGRGATGLGGNQPDRPDGNPGASGADGLAGEMGPNGRDGIYKLKAVDNFEKVRMTLASAGAGGLYQSLHRLFDDL